MSLGFEVLSSWNSLIYVTHKFVHTSNDSPDSLDFESQSRVLEIIERRLTVPHEKEQLFIASFSHKKWWEPWELSLCTSLSLTFSSLSFLYALIIHIIYAFLQILENVIKTRWKALPRPQCEGVKKYIVCLIIKTSSDAELVEKEKVYVAKLNMILVQILKHEWPKNWPSFIGDIVGASQSNESLCQNNMQILKLLSEEVY